MNGGWKILQTKEIERTGRPFRVLVVDDDAELLKTLKEVLVKQDFRVDTALSGQEAIEMVKLLSPDLVLLDVKMPGINGVKTLNILKDSNSRVPVVMMTACDEMELIEQAFSLGACDFIFKPFNMNELITNVIAKFKGDPADGKINRA